MSRMFNPEDIIFSPLYKSGEVTKGPAGCMADYTITACWNGISKEMSFKVLHEPMNPDEPDQFMYEMALDMAKRALTQIIQDAANKAERDELIATRMTTSVDADKLKLEDIQFSDVIPIKDFVQMRGTFLGTTLAAHSNREQYENAVAAGHQLKMVEDMKHSILHAFRSAHDRISRATGL